QSALHRDVTEALAMGGTGPLRGALLRPRRDGEPHQGVPARPLRRPDFGQHHARQSVAALVCLLRLRPDLRLATPWPRPHTARRGHLRIDPAEVAEDWRPGPR